MIRLLFLILSLSLVSGCQSRHLYDDTRVMLGTFVQVKSPDKNAAEIVFNEIQTIEKLLSKYDAGSEVSKLNGLGTLKASQKTFYIIKRSKEFWQKSGGAFDITVAPLVDLWGFSNKEYRLPQENEIKNALHLIGFDKIVLNDTDNMIQFRLSGMKIDLGAIAKGYALDCAVEELRQKGVKSCLINAGGQIYGLGECFGKPWIVGIKNPRKNSVIGFITIKNKAVSTSGDYEQFFIKNNKRYSHIINPKTGYPTDSGISSVTVIASDGLTADALSTAILVLGKEKGELLAKQFPDIQVKIIDE